MDTTHTPFPFLFFSSLIIDLWSRRKYGISTFSSMLTVCRHGSLDNLTSYTLFWLIVSHLSFFSRCSNAALFQMIVSHSHEDWSFSSSILRHQSAHAYDTYYLMLPHFTRHITPHHVISCHKYVIKIETKISTQSTSVSSFLFSLLSWSPKAVLPLECRSKVKWEWSDENTCILIHPILVILGNTEERRVDSIQNNAIAMHDR